MSRQACPLQAAAARAERAFAERLYNGTALRAYEQGSLAEEFPGLGVPLAEYMHWSTVIGGLLPVLLLLLVTKQRFTVHHQEEMCAASGG